MTITLSANDPKAVKQMTAIAQAMADDLDTSRAIGDQLGLHANRVSRFLSGMEKLGYAEKERMRDHHTWHLTQKGLDRFLGGGNE